MTISMQATARNATSDHGRQVRATLRRFGERLELTEHAPPLPGPHEVRVRVEAASVQFTDLLIRAGKYPGLRSKPPFATGYDFVGRIDAVGPDVSKWQVGDRVADLTVIGSHARYVVRSEDCLVRVPDQPDAAQASTLVLSWVTAKQMLFRTAKLREGQQVLIQGGAGAVGRAAIVLARGANAKVFATARPDDFDALRTLGVEPFDYRDPAWCDQVRERSKGGVDFVFDGVGQDAYRPSFRALRRGGRLVMIGYSAGRHLSTARIIGNSLRPLVLWNLWPNGKRVAFYSITAMRKRHPQWFEQDLSALLDLLARGEIDPDVAERIGFEDIDAAHARLESGGVRGKLVLIPTR